MLSFEALSHVLAEDKGDGRRPIFYGPGLELLDRYFPSNRAKGQPLWGHWGTTYDAPAVTRLRNALLHDENYRTVYTNIAFAH